MTGEQHPQETTGLFHALERRVHIGWALAFVSIALAIATVVPAAQKWLERFGEQEHERAQLARPVVTMQGALVSSDKHEARVHIWGVKHDRGGTPCDYIGLQAMSVDARGTMYDALATRVDMVETGRTKPPGVYDIGTWRIAPLVVNAVAVQVYVTHLCEGVRITTRVANVPLHTPAP